VLWTAFNVLRRISDGHYLPKIRKKKVKISLLQTKSHERYLDLKAHFDIMQHILMVANSCLSETMPDFLFDILQLLYVTMACQISKTN
jgi:hypothetical protein